MTKISLSTDKCWWHTGHRFRCYWFQLNLNIDYEQNHCRVWPEMLMCLWKAKRGMEFASTSTARWSARQHLDHVSVACCGGSPGASPWRRARTRPSQGGHLLLLLFFVSISTYYIILQPYNNVNTNVTPSLDIYLQVPMEFHFLVTSLLFKSSGPIQNSSFFT